jgi:hypothetical protein
MAPGQPVLMPPMNAPNMAQLQNMAELQNMAAQQV